jgi:hypothetical protein
MSTRSSTLVRPHPAGARDFAGLTAQIRKLDAELLELKGAGFGAHPRIEDIRRDKRRLAALAQAWSGEPPPHTD